MFILFDLSFDDVLESVDLSPLRKSDTLQSKNSWRRDIQRKPHNEELKDENDWRSCRLSHCSCWYILDIGVLWKFQKHRLFKHRNTHQLKVLRFALCIWLYHFLYTMEKPQLEGKKGGGTRNNFWKTETTYAEVYWKGFMGLLIFLSLCV